MQTLDRTKNTKRNIIWGFFNKAVTLLGPFVTRTFLIYCLGADYLGISSLYTSILQVLSLAELGFASAVVYSMYKPVAEGDVGQVAMFLNYFRVVYRWVGVSILVMGLCLLPLLGFFVEGEWPSDVNMQIAFLIYLANTVISYFLFAYKQSLLNAYQRNDVVSKVNVLVLFVQYGLQCVLLVMMSNFYAYAVVLPLCTIAGNFLTAWITKRILPEYSERSLRKLKLDREARAGVRKRVAGLVFQQVCAVTRNSLDNVIISAFIGLTAVACYSNYFVVMSGIHGVMSVLGTSMTAAVGNSVAVESKEKNTEDLRLFVFLYAMISIVASSCLLACYQPFMNLWVGADLTLPFGVAVLMVAYFYVLTMGDMRSVYVNATGIWWELRWRALAEAIANIVLNLVLVQVLGLYGVVLATLLSLFFVNFVYGSHLVFKFYFGFDKARAYYTDHAIYLVVGIVVCAIAFAVTSLVPSGGALLLLAKALVSAVCSSVLLLAAFVWTRRFRRAFGFAKHVLGGKS